MGSLCSCLEDDETDVKKPLLRSNGQSVGVRSGTLSHQPTSTTPSASARHHNPIDTRGFEKSIEQVRQIELKHIPLASIEKTFKDLGKLYNELVTCYRGLETDTHNFKEFFVEETAGIPVLAECVTLLTKRCGGAEIKVERKSKNSIEISYSATEVSRNCTVNPEQVIPALEYFKSACKNIRDVLERAKQVQYNISIILNDEETLRKDIMKADLTSEDSVEATKALLENISKLRVMAAGSDTLHRDVEQKFKEFSAASRGFFQENGT